MNDGSREGFDGSPVRRIERATRSWTNDNRAGDVCGNYGSMDNLVGSPQREWKKASLSFRNGKRWILK